MIVIRAFVASELFILSRGEIFSRSEHLVIFLELFTGEMSVE
jgi:hypothetical protein